MEESSCFFSLFLFCLICRRCWYSDIKDGFKINTRREGKRKKSKVHFFFVFQSSFFFSLDALWRLFDGKLPILLFCFFAVFYNFNYCIVDLILCCFCAPVLVSAVNVAVLCLCVCVDSAGSSLAVFSLRNTFHVKIYCKRFLCSDEFILSFWCW